LHRDREIGDLAAGLGAVSVLARGAPARGQATVGAAKIDLTAGGLMQIAGSRSCCSIALLAVAGPASSVMSSV
jgi:hypothetical protein